MTRIEALAALLDVLWRAGVSQRHAAAILHALGVTPAEVTEATRAPETPPTPPETRH